MTFNPVSVKSYGAAGAYSIFCKKVTAALLPNSASASEISNERIRQTLTSAFENSGLELTFRQACTAEKTGEVEFLDVNHCVTIEDNFGFVTKDFVKPTAEGRQFVNGNSHHPQTTLSQSCLEKLLD